MRVSGEQTGYPVAMLHPGIGSPEHADIFTDYMQEFGPEPLGGIDSAFIAGKINFPV
jgi:hypothetical protein